MTDFDLLNETSKKDKINFDINSSDILSIPIEGKENSISDLSILQNKLNQQMEIATLITKDLHLELKGNYLSLIKNPTSNKCIQELISQSNKAIIEDIYFEIREYLSEFFINQCGNYLCQKIYIGLGNILTSKAKQDFLNLLFQNFQFVACNKSGTFLVQKIITSMKSEYEHTKLYEFIRGMSLEVFDRVSTVSLLIN